MQSKRRIHIIISDLKQRFDINFCILHRCLNKIICSSLLIKDKKYDKENWLVYTKCLKLKEIDHEDPFQSELFVPAVMPVSAFIDTIYQDYFNRWSRMFRDEVVLINENNEILFDREFCKEYIKLSMIGDSQEQFVKNNMLHVFRNFRNNVDDLN